MSVWHPYCVVLGHSIMCFPKPFMFFAFGSLAWVSNDLFHPFLVIYVEYWLLENDSFKLDLSREGRTKRANRRTTNAASTWISAPGPSTIKKSVKIFKLYMKLEIIYAHLTEFECFCISSAFNETEFPLLHPFRQGIASPIRAAFDMYFRLGAWPCYERKLCKNGYAFGILPQAWNIFDISFGKWLRVTFASTFIVCDCGR